MVAPSTLEATKMTLARHIKTNRTFNALQTNNKTYRNQTTNALKNDIVMAIKKLH